MFKFKLQTVLDVKKTIEEKAQHEFSQQQIAVQKEEEKLHVIIARINELTDILRNIQGKKLAIFEITMTTDEITKWKSEEEIQIKRIEQAKKILDIKRGALLEAVKNRKAMEIMKSRHYEKYLSDMNQLEQNASDEMTIVRHKRREEA